MTSELPSTWSVVRLADVCDVFDGPHATPARTNDGPVFLGIANLDNGRLDLSETRRLSESDFVRWTKRVTPQTGDVVFSYETRLGQAARIPDGLRCCLGRRMGLLRVKNNSVNTRLLLYAYLGPFFQEVIRERTVHGSTVDRIPIKTMGTFPFAIPPPDEQQRIAQVLGALDDKVESNRRLITMLGTLSGTIFAQAEVGVGDSACLGDFVEVIDCLHSKKPVQRTDGKLLLQLENVREDGLIDLGCKFMISEDDYANWTRRLELRAGDCVITNVGRVGAVARMPRSNAALGRNMTGLRCRPHWPNPSVLIEALRSSRMRREIDLLTDTGTVMNALNVRNIPRLPVAAFEREPLGRLQATLEPMWLKREALLAESARLAAVRDALLPKLVSGQIRVPDTSDVEEAVGPIAEELVA